MRIFLDAQVLTKMGHRVAILTVPGGGLGAKARDAGLRVVETPMGHALSPAAILRFIRFFKRERFEVVNTHSSVDSWLGSLAAKAVGVPVLVRTRHLSVPLNTHALNFVYKMPDGFVTTAETIRRRMIEVNGMPPERVVSIPTGVDLSQFDPATDPEPVRREFGLLPENRVIGMVAVLRSWKRHEIFLEASARLAADRPELRFLIVGDGPRRPEVTAKIRELGLENRAIMTGHRSDVPAVMAACDILALTSKSSEGVPQSVLQAQAMGKPVVGTQAGGIPEVIEHGVTGLLCPVNDPEALAAAMARLLDEPGLAEAIGRNARRRVEEKHSREAMARATLEFYDFLRRAKEEAHAA
jgi:glycosyltransferase involved in cell wall biosynthesis